MSGEAFKAHVEEQRPVRGLTSRILVGKSDPEGAILEMMTTVGAQLATMVVEDWRDRKRDINIAITVTLEDATS